MFIQTEVTPNPTTLKFLPGQTVLNEGSLHFTTSEEAINSPLAQRLFSIQGVCGVFLSYDFLSVTIEEENWQHMKPVILGAIMEHFMSDAPIINTSSIDNENDEEFFNEADQQTVDAIKELLETRVRPAVAQDGGDIVFRGFRDGRVFLQMRGACAGCPSSTMTLQHGIQNLLKHFLPEVESVEAV